MVNALTLIINLNAARRGVNEKLTIIHVLALPVLALCYVGFRQGTTPRHTNQTGVLEMSKDNKKAPAVLEISTPVTRGKCAPYMPRVRELCTGAGMSVKGLMEAMNLPEKLVRGTIDAIRNAEGEVIRNEKGEIVERTGTTRIFPKVGAGFQYRGLDGKGYVPNKA
jgi:hypothetical protein